MSHQKETFGDAMQSIIQLLAGAFFVSAPFLAVFIMPGVFGALGYKGYAIFALGSSLVITIFAALAWYMVAVEYFKPIFGAIFFAPIFFGSLFYFIAWI